MKRSSLTMLLALLMASALYAQDPTPPAEPEPQESPEAEIEQDLQEILEEPATTDSYRYDPQGRRDPFRSLVGPKIETRTGDRPEGTAGFLIDEMDLQGVIRTRQGLVAMINGPDNSGYLLRVGDKVFDGEVIQITADSVIFRQEVNDPISIERFRQVVKELAPQATSAKKR